MSVIEMPRDSLAQRHLARGDQVCDGDRRIVILWTVGHVGRAVENAQIGPLSV